MSADVTAWLDGLEAAQKAAWDEVTGLCDGSRRWTMRVPVDEARDSDTVIAAALNGTEQLIAAVRGALALADELEADDISYSYAAHSLRSAVTAAIEVAL